MSKIGKQIIKIPAGIAVAIDEHVIRFKSGDKELTVPLLNGIKPVLENGELKFSISADTKQNRSNWGTIASLSLNAIEGLTKGFEKTLIIEGIGYRASKEGNDLVLSVGFSHPVRYSPPAGITIDIEKNTILHIKGFSKEAVGQTAAEIRAVKKPEPYKGTGIRYADEVIRRKAGKKAVATTT